MYICIHIYIYIYIPAMFEYVPQNVACCAKFNRYCLLSISW